MILVFPLVPQVGNVDGCMDLAIVHPKKGNYFLGIECDGENYHSYLSTRDRDRLRPQVLKNLGWHVHRIWSKDWFDNSQREWERLCQTVKKAELQEEKVLPETSKEIFSPLERKLSDSSVGEKIPDYQQAEIKLFVSDLEALSEMDINCLANIIREIVQVESPIHVKEVSRRISNSIGIERLTSKVKKIVEKGSKEAIKNQKIKKLGDFLWDFELTEPTLRNRQNLAKISKRFELIPPEEICLAIEKVVLDSHGIERKDVPLEAMQIIGFKRVTSEVKKTIDIFISKLIKNKKLFLENDYLISNLHYSSVRDVLTLPKKQITFVREASKVSFVAIDFETANPDYASPCALEVTIVESGEIVHSQSWLIRPKDMTFYYKNMKIHGISKKDVIDQPEFPELWFSLKSILNNKLVIAHNANFDMNVLRQTLDLYGLEYPKIKYACTKEIAQKVWSDSENHKLSTLANNLEIPLIHHDPKSDSIACAKLAMKACLQNNFTSLENLLDQLELPLEKLHTAKFTTKKLSKTSKTSQKIRVYPSHPKISDLVPSTDEFDPEHPCYQKKFCFSGDLKSMIRGEAWQKVVDLGGTISSGVTRKTNFLVIGKQNLSLIKDEEKSSKMIKAESLVEEGLDIKMIDEMCFLDMLEHC